MKSLVQKKWFNMLCALMIIIGVTVAVLLNPSDAIRVHIEQETLWIEGPEEFQTGIPVGTVQQVLLVESPVYDEIVQTTGNVVCGRYVNDQWGEHSLCVNKQIPACIVVYSQDGTCVFNFEDLDTTRWFYSEFRAYLEEDAT